MPELPEVEVVRRGLEARVLGRRVSSVLLRAPALREPIPKAAIERHIVGRKLVAVRRRAKYVLLDFDGGWSLVVHLGMSGRLVIVPAKAPAPPHEHAVFRLSDRREIRLRDPRRFGLLLALETAKIERDRHFSALGAEPLSADFDPDFLSRAAARRSGPVKTFIMDARVVVGVGNIYASEALFRAGIHPRRSVARLAARRLRALRNAVVEVLGEAIEQGGTTLNDFVDPAGSPGYFSVQLDVYGRDGESCRLCAAPIRRIVQAGRSTFYCPRCQR